MKIKEITIKNFRSFENEIIKFPDINKPITIIWENNSWKSNIIKAILYWIGYKYLWEDGIIESDFHNQNTINNIEIYLKIENEWTENNIIFRSLDNFRDPPVLKLNWKFYWKNEKNLFTSKVFYYDFQQVANLLKIKSDFSYTPLWKIVRNIKNKFKENYKLQEEVNEKIEFFINESIWNDNDYQNFKKKIWENLKKNLKNHSEDFDLKHTIQDVDKIINGLSFFIQENKNKPLISVENFWSWFRSLLVFSIFEAISDSWEGWNIYIFEEPETFLHENFEEYFYELLQKLSEKNQVIITTHSKKFVDIFNTNTIIRLNNNENTSHKTKIHQTSIWQDTINNINNILTMEDWEIILEFPNEYWTYMKAIEPNLWLIAFSKKIIIVEWPHDLLAYKYTFEKFLEEKWYISKSLWYLWINIVCVHNKDLIWPLMYICKQLWTEVFIIFDSDLPENQEINLKEWEEINFYDFYVNSDYKNEEPYLSLEPRWRQHYTKTLKLVAIAKKFNFWFQINKPKLEWVLDFKILDEEKLSYKNKSSIEIFNRIKDKKYQEIKQQYPNFITDDLENFIS